MATLRWKKPLGNQISVSEFVSELNVITYVVKSKGQVVAEFCCKRNKCTRIQVFAKSSPDQLAHVYWNYHSAVKDPILSENGIWEEVWERFNHLGITMQAWPDEIEKYI